VTRDLLAFLLGALTLAAGLATALVQSDNRARALHLDEVRSECRMLEAIVSAYHADLVALDWGPEAGREAETPQPAPVPAEASAP
jgi:hypothetical protein